MNFDPDRHHRRSIRIPGYDYAQVGTYFVTACTQNRDPLFGQVVDGAMSLNPIGSLVESVWLDLPRHHDQVDIDAFIVMPNHIHGLIVLNQGVEQNRRKQGLSEIVRAFKAFSARRINQARGLLGVSVWQGNYYEHVVRNEASLRRIREYIYGNPGRWASDPENPGPARE